MRTFTLCTNRDTCSGHQSTKGPSWGYQRLVIGAIGSFLSTFGENRPRFLKNLPKLTFEYPHEGPCVVVVRPLPPLHPTLPLNPTYTLNVNDPYPTKKAQPATPSLASGRKTARHTAPGRTPTLGSRG